MKSSKVREIALRAYDIGETALYATAFALVIYFLAVILPDLPENNARMERVRTIEIAAENALFCEELGTKRGTDQYNQCLLDVGAFRLKVEKRIFDENGPL
jgi:hypothetical protein